MEKNNTHINNHFIQKAFAKNFSKNGKIEWVRYKTEEKGIFHIVNTQNKNQPIVIEDFYSQEIETGMNKLEDHGIKVIRKIAKEANALDEVSLTREDLMTLKFYFLLATVRTDKLRNNMKDLTGDSLFNKYIKKDGRTPKEIQEKKISLVLKYYATNRQKLVGDISRDWESILKLNDLDLGNKTFEQAQKELQENNIKRMNTKSIELTDILLTMDSRLLIFKFEKPKLFLMEANSFFEPTPEGGIIYNFMPISPNIGIAFYFDPIISRGILPNYNSTIFENDISKARHRVKYKNRSLMRKMQIRFMKSHKPKTKLDNINLSRIFWATKAPKYHSNRYDRYIYEVLMESEDAANSCNAMALVHNKYQILIYQKEKDIEDAERQIIKRRIVRNEDLKRGEIK